MKLIRNLTVVALFSSQTAMAADLNLGLQVTGDRFDTYWEVNGTRASVAAFDFEGYVGNAGDAVDSNAQSIKLVDTKRVGSSQNAVYTAPNGCTIGGTHSVPATDVLIVDGSTEVSGGGQVGFTEGSGKALKLRLAASGNHGAATGAVACGQAGRLTYSY